MAYRLGLRGGELKLENPICRDTGIQNLEF